MLRLSFFNYFAAYWEQEPLKFPTESTRALLAYLVLERERPQPRRRLAMLLWPDGSEEKALRNLRQTLLRLRQTVPDTADGLSPILTTAETLQWNTAYPTQVDVLTFTEYVAQAAPHLTAVTPLPYPTIVTLQAAANLYQGKLLPGFAQINDLYAEWLLPWRDKYQQEAVQVFYWLGQAYGRIGDLPQQAAMARRQLQLQPHREEAHAQLMHVYLAQREFTAVIHQYTLCQQQLLEKWGISATAATRALFEMAWQWREDKSPSLPHIPHNLPPEETPFYGRSAELTELLLRSADPGQRLITITGLGGVGKTRLALATARCLAQPLPATPPLFAHGVWFISLAEAITTSTANDLAQAILSACGWDKKEDETAVTAVSRHLQSSQTILVLDNLEHLDNAAEFVLHLLNDVPNLCLLTTSRHRLGLQREVVFPLAGLPVPQNDDDTVVASVALFVERAQRIDRTFGLHTAVTPYVTRLCRFLQGWPLALELAAAWIDQMPLMEIEQTVVRQMESMHTFMPDLPTRQRSIQAVLAGSFALLTPSQQQAFAQFAVFHNGCTLAAAQQVLGASAADMERLVQLTLLSHHNGRYTIHELIRQYAAYCLAQSPHPQAAKDAHSRYYLSLVEQQEAALHGPQPLLAINQLRPEQENIQYAWFWAVLSAAYGRLQAPLTSLIRFYRLTSMLQTAQTLFAQARLALLMEPGYEDLTGQLTLAQAEMLLRSGEFAQALTLLQALPPLPPALALTKHYLLGELYRRQDQQQQALFHTQAALPLARTLHNRRLEAMCLSLLDTLSDYTTHYQAEALAIVQQLQDRWLEGSVLNSLGAAEMRYGRYTNARTYWQAALVIAQELGEWYTAATLHNNLGDTLRQLGIQPQAEQYFTQALVLYDRIAAHSLKVHPLEGLARLYWHKGQLDEAQVFAQKAYEGSVATAVISIQIASLNCLGHIHATRREWAYAQEYYNQAQLLAGEEWPRLRLEGLAGLAWASLHLDQLPSAHRHTEQLLTLLATCQPEGFADPALVYWRGYEVLRALHDARADEVLYRGRTWLKQQLSLIASDEEQQLFLQNVPATATLQAPAIRQPMVELAH